MKKILTTITFISLLFGSHAIAEHPEHDHNHNHDNHQASSPQKSASKVAENGVKCENTVEASVNGLVCDFCARALEKIFSKKDEVDNISVNLNEAKVVIVLKEGQTIADDVLTNLITDSGYNVTDINKGC